MEAAGVELITPLKARKLLILGSATRAKKAPLPDPLYVYCTKILSSETCRTPMARTVYPRILSNASLFRGSPGLSRQTSRRSDYPFLRLLRKRPSA